MSIAEHVVLCGALDILGTEKHEAVVARLGFEWEEDPQASSLSSGEDVLCGEQSVVFSRVVLDTSTPEDGPPSGSESSRGQAHGLEEGDACVSAVASGFRAASRAWEGGAGGAGRGTRKEPQAEVVAEAHTVSLRDLPALLCAPRDKLLRFVKAVLAGASDAASDALEELLVLSQRPGRPLLPVLNLKERDWMPVVQAARTQPEAVVRLPVGSLEVVWSDVPQAFECAAAIRASGIVATAVVALVHMELWRKEAKMGSPMMGLPKIGQLLYASKVLAVESTSEPVVKEGGDVLIPYPGPMQAVHMTIFRCKKLSGGVGNTICTTITHTLHSMRRLTWERKCGCMLVYATTDSPLVVDKLYDRFAEDRDGGGDCVRAIFNALSRRLGSRGFRAEVESDTSGRRWHRVYPAEDSACMVLATWDKESHSSAKTVVLDALPKLRTALRIRPTQYVLSNLVVDPGEEATTSASGHR